MFLWIVVTGMAVALAGEVIALIGIAFTISRAVRHSTLLKNEVGQRLRTSIRTGQEIVKSVRPNMEKIWCNGAEIAISLRTQSALIREVWQDVNRRGQRLHLRFRREGVATVEQLQRGRSVVSRGVLKPIRTAASVAVGVRATTWLLRKVA